jgi:hypothetical protein
VNIAFDKLDYHLDGARQAGQPEEHAFTHIGLYLAWLIRHDLHNPDVIRDHWADAIKGGEMTGSDLADAIDGSLVSDLMAPEGAAFSAAYYQDYLGEYGETFAAEGDYAVADDPDAYERIGAALDRRYADWVARGRPSPKPPEAEPSPARPGGIGIPDDDELERLRSESLAELDALAEQEGWVIEESPSSGRMPHAAEGLEALIPVDITSPPMETSSLPASQYGNALLKRSLKRLNVKPKECLVADGMGGTAQDLMTVTLFGVPNVAAGDLEREFVSVIHRPSGGRWEARDVDAKRVQWLDGSEFHVAFWAVDGCVVWASAGSDDDLQRLVSRLP